MSAYKLLESIDCPSDLRKLDESALLNLTHELREYLLDLVNETGGHLASSLGTIELTVALHYVYNTPVDKIIWDVGHQTYPHKILTQRRTLMRSLRQKDGIAPFPRREESIYDTFGVGHSSTSISAGLGMSLANRLKGLDDKVVAVIGDGAMTAGMAFEALNHGGDTKADMLVILNDNDMSISSNVGALSNYLAQILSSKLYSSVKEGSKKILSRVPPMWEFARRTESHLKGMVVPGSLFESMGFNYIGPIDGHDVHTLVKTLKKIKELKGPQFLHIITQKGKGYTPAEADPIKYHGVTKGFYDVDRKLVAPTIQTGPKVPTYSQVFGSWLCDMAKVEPRLVGITPAMREGSGMVEFSKQFSERYIDVGIAEQHSVTLAAGLACEGLRPVVAIYSSFLQRAYDQLIHDVALQNLPVLFALDRAGLVNDGPTHSGTFDLSYLRCIPNMVVMTPSDENECRQMLTTGLKIDGPCAVRYPRGEACGIPMDMELTTLPIGKANIIKSGQGIAILCFGTLLHKAKQAAEHFGATLVDMRFVKPLDENLLAQLAQTHFGFVTLEENVIQGGAGSGVNEYIASLPFDASRPQMLNLGIPDFFIEHASQEQMLEACGLTSDLIISSIELKFGQFLNTACQNNHSTVESST